MTAILDDFLMVLMFIATMMVIFSKDLVHAVMGLCLFSMVLSLQYFLLNAPDVAITEAALGVGLSTLIFVIAIRKTRRDNSA